MIQIIRDWGLLQKVHKLIESPAIYQGVSRRDFLRYTGIGAVAVAAPKIFLPPRVAVPQYFKNFKFMLNGVEVKAQPLASGDWTAVYGRHMFADVIEAVDREILADYQRFKSLGVKLGKGT
ncbi:MAG: twin-arginine translocation signal domain-containing protein [Candidatus Saccharimonadales bacterium]